MKGDILMSELLGSFGDNELSPECLNPTAKYLKPGGIFVHTLIQTMLCLCPLRLLGTK